MKRALMLVLATTVATPALAQHEGHTPAPAQQSQQQSEPAAADPHAGHNMPSPTPSPATGSGPAADPHAGHAVPSAQAPAAQGAAGSADPHAGHVMPQQSAPAEGADPHTAHNMPAASESDERSDPHTGHQMQEEAEEPASEDSHGGHNMAPEVAADPHAGHTMAPAQLPPAGPPPAEAFSGPVHGADVFYGESQMSKAREELIQSHGALPAYRVLVDQLEARISDGSEGYAWDAEAWFGGDINKLWVTSEGEGTFGESVDDAEVQALFSRAVDPWFDVQVGVRQDFTRGPDRTHLVAGIQGLAPYWFEIEAMAFLSNEGEVTARFEAEYDLRLTQALIFQPAVELNLALQDSPDIQVGSGLSTAEIGARLRYELYPSSGPAVIAPYVGVQYERAFGQTARYYRTAGDDVDGWNLLLGVRTAF